MEDPIQRARHRFESMLTSAEQAAEWAAEGAVERVNDGGLAWVVIAKRRGTTDPLRQWVLTEVGELIALINGNRAHMDVEEP